jgi:hypothetical protein
MPTNSNKLEVVRFAVNIPQTVIIRSQGKSVDSHFSGAEQFFYRLDGGRSMYVAPFVHNRMQDQGVMIGDTVTICKRDSDVGKHGNAIIWEVTKSTQSIAELNRAEMERKPQAAAALLDRVQSIDGMPDETPRKPVKTLLEHALCTALTAAKGAEEYSQSIGHPIQFDKDDIRLMAQTLVINAARDGRAA